MRGTRMAAAIAMVCFCALSVRPVRASGSRGFRQDAAGRDARLSDFELYLKCTIPGNAGWMDTAIDVEEGQEFYFEGEGTISLQKGNTEAVCGPDGYDFRSVQQPLLDQNLGALIGKVVMVLDVRMDEETGEETRDELVRYFPIGAASFAAMPLKGRLYLGINENVFKDNDGELTVLVYHKKK